MKKREQKLRLHRETLVKLDSQGLAARDLAGVVAGGHTSCIPPDCACATLEPNELVRRDF